MSNQEIKTQEPLTFGQYIFGGVLFIVAALSPAAVFVDLVVSTVYYNYFDGTITQLETMFDNGQYGNMDCNQIVVDEDGKADDAACEGGVLAARDYYLHQHDVLSMGRWSTDGAFGLGPSTFRLYFRWF